MRWHLLQLRAFRVMIPACAFMVGIYVGRVSVLHTWMEKTALAVWVLILTVWNLLSYREIRREERAFKREMAEIARNLR